MVLAHCRLQYSYTRREKNIDIEGLSKVISCTLLAGGLAIVVFVIAFSAGFVLLRQLALFIGPITFSRYLVWRTQKYGKSNPVTSRITAIWTTVFIGVLVVSISAGILYTSRAAVITASSQQIHISGIYGTTVPIDAIQEIKLLNAIPLVQWKSNGFTFASVRKGKFHLQEWGEGRLYLLSDDPPFVYLKTNESYLLINYKNTRQTKQVYEQLYANWKK